MEPAARIVVTHEHSKPTGLDAAPLIPGHVADRSHGHTELVKVKVEWYPPGRATHRR